MLQLTATFGAGLLVSLGMLAALVHSPLARYFSDAPNHRKVHQRAVPRIGGLGITLSFLLLLAAARAFGPWDPAPVFLKSLAFITAFLLVAGTLDDVYSLGYKVKFLLQFFLAGVVVSVFKVQFEEVSILGRAYSLGGMGPIISIFWMVGLMNAVNIIDGIDGLAAGVALCGLIGVGILAHAAGATGIVAVCLAMSGVLLGFLCFNLQMGRHKVFLGDTGSQFLGALLGLLIMGIHWRSSVRYSPLIPFLLVSYPLMDTSVAMARRFLKSRRGDLGHRFSRMFLADNGHLHHRLVYSGLSHLQATFLLMVLSSGFCAAAILLPRVSWVCEAAILAYLLLVFALVLYRLGFLNKLRSLWRKNPPGAPAKPFRFRPRDPESAAGKSSRRASLEIAYLSSSQREGRPDASPAKTIPIS